METKSYIRGKKRLFSRVWDMPYGSTNQFHLFDATKNSKEFVQKLQLQIKIPVHTGCVNSICWNDSGKYLLSGSDDQRLAMVHGYDYSVLAYVQTGHRANIFSAKFLPNTSDSHVVSCSGDGIIIYSDLDRPETSLNNKFNCHVGTAYEIMTVPNDPNSFLSCGEDRTVRWFDLRAKSACANDDCKEDILINCRSPVTSLAVNPLTPYQLAVGCADASVRLFDRRMLGTRATGNVSSNGFQALMACFTVPEFTQSRRITSLCYSNDGQEMLVSYSSDYIYLFDVKDDLQKSPRLLSSDSPSNGSDNDSGMHYQGRSLMKRLRVRGDWSDTGPNARPEAESRATTSTSGEQQPEPSSRATRMRWMTDVLQRMFNSNNPRNRATSASQSSSSQLQHDETNVAEGNEDGQAAEGGSTQNNEEPRRESDDSKPSTSRGAKLGLRKFSEKTKNRLKNIACCRLGGPQTSTSSYSCEATSPTDEPITSQEGEGHGSSYLPQGSAAGLLVLDDAMTVEAEIGEPSQSLQSLEQELTTRRSDLIEKHHIEPMVNLHYSGQSVSSGLITMDVTSATETNERQWHEQCQNPEQGPRDMFSSNNEATDGPPNVSNADNEVDAASIAQLPDEGVADKSADSSSRLPAVVMDDVPTSMDGVATNADDGATSMEDAAVDDAIQTIQLNPDRPIIEVSASSSGNSDVPDSEENPNAPSQLGEGDVALMMEVDSWDVDSDEDIARLSSPQPTVPARRTSSDSRLSDTIYQTIADETQRRKEEQEKEEAHMANVAHPRVKRKYTGHRNARTMIKEATFWGNNFIMSGSDCGHIFIWDRLTTELVMMMEADHHVVNCLQPHPFDPILASSGIDYDIKLWAPTREEPLFDEEKANEMIKRNEVMLEETKDTITVPASFMIRMLDTLNHFRFGHGYSWSRAARDVRSASTDPSNR